MKNETVTRTTSTAGYVPPPSLETSPGFIESIAHGWSAPSVETGVVAGAAASALAHRNKLSSLLLGSTIVVASGDAQVRNDDCDFDFRPDSAFVWLTACQAEGAVLVMRATNGGHDATLYLPKPFGPGDQGFFADTNHGELWAGPLPSLDSWQRDLDIAVSPLQELPSNLTTGVLASASTTRFLPDIGEPSSALDQVLSELRMVKDAWEIEQLRGAVDMTIAGFAAVTAEIPRAVSEGLGERWLQGTFDRFARTHGNGPGYSTIVGSGPHAPVLHWVRCDGMILPDTSVLLDMGVESRTLYTADVTRTIPASGTFTDVERLVHNLVERAHRSALSQVRPGNRYGEYQNSAMEVIAQGLSDWGLLSVSVDEALSPGGQHHRRYICCSIGHHLGLDVHDCSKAGHDAYGLGELKPNMVLAVEPGLYFHANDLTVPPELRGIGIRLEDNVLITSSGAEVLSAALPIDASGLELWTQEQQRNARP